MSASKPLEEALKLAFRAYCEAVATTNPATTRHGTTGWTGANMSAMYCPFCGAECTFGHIPDRTLSPVELDELCPNGCMKMAPQVTLRVGDAVEGGTIATFQADGKPLLRVDTRTLSWNEIQQLAAKQMAPVPMGATEDMPGHGCYTMPPDADPYRFEASLQYGVPYEEVTQAQRDAIKSQRFGELYGVGAAAIKRAMEPLAAGDRVRRLPLEVYQSEGVIEDFRSSGVGRPLALVRFAQASYSVLVNQDELVRV